MSSNTVKIKYFSADYPHLGEVDKAQSEWVDLYTDESVTIDQFDSAFVKLGVAMQLPAGYEAIIAPRSSMFKKYGVILSNSIGVIDNSYSGDNDQWQANLIALRPDVVIPRHERLLQFRLVKTMPAGHDDFSFETVDHLEGPDRGGFGSTGHN